MADSDSDGLQLSGERFTAVYRIRAEDEAAAVERARAICLEQTVEFPWALIPNDAIRAGVVGQLREIRAAGAGRFDADIGYPIEAAGGELTQLINVLFGNVSLQPGVRLMDFRLPAALMRHYRGPRFGISGLRALLGVHHRPLLCTAIKPMGLSPSALAGLAYRLALGGIDFIKDDHGLADQPFCPFNERVARCAEAVRRANRESGQQTLYLPNVTAPSQEIGRRARLARDAGAGGLLFCPGLAGLDAMRSLADDDSLALPIVSHPAFQGSFTVSGAAGLSHRVLHGRLNRLAGADAAIFPHVGGRFSYAERACTDIIAGCTEAMESDTSQGDGHIAAIFPVPAGGMQLDRIGELVTFYGRDCILLIGSDLHAQDTDLVQRCRRFRALVEAADTPRRPEPTARLPDPGGQSSRPH